MKEAMRPRAALMMAALGLAVALSAAPAANAAFPGSNGRILFTSNLAGRFERDLQHEAQRREAEAPHAQQGG